MLLQRKTGCRLLLLNDADAAGIAEMRFGAGKGHMGVVIMVTLGTGIGSALFFEGRLIPKTDEFQRSRGGHFRPRTLTSAR
jgi:polyphosphate glucokinase